MAYTPFRSGNPTWSSNTQTGNLTELKYISRYLELELNSRDQDMIYRMIYLLLDMYNMEIYKKDWVPFHLIFDPWHEVAADPRMFDTQS